MTNCRIVERRTNSRVCEYCWTPREKSPDEIRMALELEQARLNAEQAWVSDVELRQTVALQQRMQAVRSDIMRQKHSEEQFYSHLLCFVILTFLLPLAIPICLILSIKTAIVAKLLGMFLIPTWFCLGYIISLRGMKRYKGSRR